MVITYSSLFVKKLYDLNINPKSYKNIIETNFKILFS